MSETTPVQDARLSRSRVPAKTKVFYGVGGLPEVLKDFAFVTLLLFYYNQVQGLSAGLASLALMIALVIDAVTDPLVAYWSDNLRTKLGRRHPFMYLSALPLAAALFLVFSPPSGLEPLVLFIWLTLTAVAARVAITFFQVPWLAMLAELSDDYSERTTITTIRFAISWLGVAAFMFGVWGYVFPSSETHTPGHLNPAGYPLFGGILGATVLVAILISTHFTRSEIPYLHRARTTKPALSPASFFGDVIATLKNRNFRILFSCVLVSAAILGTYKSLELYVNTFFWDLTPEDLKWFALIVIGPFLAFGFVAPLQKRFEKRTILIGCLLLVILDGFLIIGLRLVDVLPPNDSALLLPILIGNAIFRMGVLTVLSIMFISMVADVADEQELISRERQEGMISASISFSSKATTGIGTLIGGVLLEYLILFPTSVPEAGLTADTIVRLGVIGGMLVPAFYILSILLIRNYDLNREKHDCVKAQISSIRPPGPPAQSASSFSGSNSVEASTTP